MASSPEDHRVNALIKLGITEAQLAQCPMISHITKVVGETRKVMEYMRGSEDERARPLCEQADILFASELDAVPIEAICLAAKMPPKKFLGFLMEEVSEQSKMQTALLAKASHPDVVAATVATALVPGKNGVQDRKMLHLAQGLLPVPKTNVTFFNRATIDARTQTVNATLAPVEASVRRISERFIAAPAANIPVAVLAEPEEEEED